MEERGVVCIDIGCRVSRWHLFLTRHRHSHRYWYTWSTRLNSSTCTCTCRWSVRKDNRVGLTPERIETRCCNEEFVAGWIDRLILKTCLGAATVHFEAPVSDAYYPRPLAHYQSLPVLLVPLFFWFCVPLVFNTIGQPVLSTDSILFLFKKVHKRLLVRAATVEFRVLVLSSVVRTCFCSWNHFGMPP